MVIIIENIKGTLRGKRHTKLPDEITKNSLLHTRFGKKKKAVVNIFVEQPP